MKIDISTSLNKHSSRRFKIRKSSKNSVIKEKFIWQIKIGKTIKVKNTDLNTGRQGSRFNQRFQFKDTGRRHISFWLKFEKTAPKFLVHNRNCSWKNINHKKNKIFKIQKVYFCRTLVLTFFVFTFLKTRDPIEF